MSGTQHARIMQASEIYFEQVVLQKYLDSLQHAMSSSKADEIKKNSLTLLMDIHLGLALKMMRRKRITKRLRQYGKTPKSLNWINMIQLLDN